MKGSSGQPAPLVADDATFSRLVATLDGVQRIALDTEAASFHRYVDRVYLIQVSTDGETFLIDPLAVQNLDPIGRWLADSRVEVVFHDADYDLRILDRDFGFRATTLFDTRVAAQLAGEPAVGLGALLLKYFGVRLNKKLQRADWSRRPLTTEMLIYAADDTRFLPALRDTLEEQLEAMGRLSWAQEEFRRLEEIRWTAPAGNDEEAYLRIRGAKAIRSPRTRAVLRALHNWRDETARARDQAPFRVAGNDTLLAIARAVPTNMAALAATPAVAATTVKRHGEAILAAVSQALALPEQDLPAIPQRVRPPPDPSYDQRLERLKRLRNDRAASIDMDPGLLCPNGTLQALARGLPTTAAELELIPELRTWQREVLGDEDILETLKS